MWGGRGQIVSPLRSARAKFAPRLGEIDIASRVVAGLEGLIVLQGGHDPLVSGSLDRDHSHPEAVFRRLSHCPEASGRMGVSSEGGDAGQLGDRVHVVALVAEAGHHLQRLSGVAFGLLVITLG